MTPAHDSSHRVSFKRSLLPMLVVDCQRRYVDANHAACLLLRLPRERVLQLRIEDLTPPESLAMLTCRWDEFIAAGTQAGVHEFRMPDGQPLARRVQRQCERQPGASPRDLGSRPRR